MRSVFEQAYRPIECIVVDDGSTDDTAGVIAQLEKEQPGGVEVRYFAKENGGANSARNRGLRESTGELVCYLDSDDYLLPGSVETRARVLVENPDTDLCYGLASIQDEDGNEIRIIGEPWPAEGEARIVPYLFCSSAPLVRRSLCTKAGPWWEADTFGQEYEYFTRLKYFANEVVFIDRVLSIYVRHDKESLLHKFSIPFSRAVHRVLLAVKALIVYSEYDVALERFELARLFRCLGRQFYYMRDYPKACAALEEAFLLGRSPKVFAQWHVVACMSIIAKLFRRKRHPSAVSDD